jgi:importin-9
LQGRGFVFASHFARLLPEDITGQYMEAALGAIEAAEASVPVKVSAVKAVQKWVLFHATTAKCLIARSAFA